MEIAEKRENYAIVFISEATVSLGDAALHTLLRQARAEHEQASLTGFLLYNEGWFMQVMEGPAAPLQEFFGRIALDPRHCKVEVLADGPRATPDFSGWHMSFPLVLPCPMAAPANFRTLPELLALAEETSVQPLLTEFLARCCVPLA